MRSSQSRFIFECGSCLESFNNSLDRFRVWHLLKLLFETPECNFVRTGSKILFNHVGALFQSIAFWTWVGHVSQKILYWLIIWKLVCVLIVMDQEWSRSWYFLNKLIREFLLSIFRSEALFGHPVHKKFIKVSHGASQNLGPHWRSVKFGSKSKFLASLTKLAN